MAKISGLATRCFQTISIAQFCIMFETNQFLGQDPAPSDAAFRAGYLAGQLIFILILAVLAAKFFKMARRPTTNSKCALSLAVFLTAITLSGLGGIVTRLNPELRFLAVFGGLISFAGIIAGIVLAIIGLVEYGNQRGRYTQGIAQAVWTLSLSFVIFCMAAVLILTRVTQAGNNSPRLTST